MHENITGIILSGGKSSRMGENKSLLKLGEITVIEHIVKLMQSIFSEVILITNSPSEYKFLEIPMYEDIYKNRGPIAGIHSGLINSKTDDNFIISCDIPLITSEIINYLVNVKTNEPITVCKVDGFIQQLAAKYSKSVLPHVSSMLKFNDKEIENHGQNKKKLSVFSLINSVGAEIVETSKLDFYKDSAFLNMNRKKDYENILNIFNQEAK